jgi:23S rRNA (adenine-N6)-dimethyltransferase
VRAYGVRPWGWHRLGDRWAERIVADAAISPGDLVVDIGAGTGALTAHLVAAGARVIAVELHPRRLAVLRERFAGAPVTVVRADVGSLRLPRRPFRVVANPPFAVTTAVLRRLLAPRTRLVAADLVLQHAAARRWASPGAPGAGRWSRDHVASLGLRIPRSAFDPPPAVDCTTLVIRPRQSSARRRARSAGQPPSWWGSAVR